MAGATTQVKILVPGNQSMVALLGQRDVFLKLIESAFECRILVRGNEITVTGGEVEAEHVARIFEELLALLEKGHELTDASVGQIIALVKGDEAEPGDDQYRPSDVLGDRLLTARGKGIAPKTIGQKRFVDAIRSHTVTFAIGPAGTGKTYLAVATAVKALQEHQVSRLILTRPAVEAGERLGYLPGTLYEKIDPYMRPLYDALFEMTGAETLPRLMERGTVEVAPLAYMRGRAQPLDRQVLTPDGFGAIGDLAVGDLVIGSDGRPTPVLGVFPQGREPVFQVMTQDGASTLCSGEHLWAVSTPADRGSGRSSVLETTEMFGRLRADRSYRLELPLVSRPVSFAPADVPMDPYALGRSFGDGCRTPVATPSFADADRLGRGGILVEDPVTPLLRPGLDGCRSEATVVPRAILCNTVDVRLAVLQGLLDDGARLTRARRRCRIRYATASSRLRDDIVFLVRSLGGIASVRATTPIGRPPARARGRSVERRSSSFVIDIRLPAGLAPFRLARKMDIYAALGEGGRPMRYVAGIEPAGTAETVCIQVGAADSLYVTDDFLVTHNTLNDAFIILDEAQNTTPEQMKMFLTRIGFGSKAVINGDSTQTDLGTGQNSGLSVIQEVLAGIDGIAFCHLGGRDVVRHKIVQEIVAAYDRFGQQRLRVDP